MRPTIKKSLVAGLTIFTAVTLAYFIGSTAGMSPELYLDVWVLELEEAAWTGFLFGVPAGMLGFFAGVKEEWREERRG